MSSHTAIEIITQQVKALADPAATFAQIEAGLGDLWNAAEARGDTETIGFLQVVWDNTQQLAGNNTAANNVAAAALQTAVEMAEFAVEAQQELLEVQESIPDLVEDAFDRGLEHGTEGLLEQILNSYNGEVYFEDPGEEVLIVLKYEVQRSHADGEVVRVACTESQAGDFVRYLGGHTPPMGEAIARRVAEMIAEFGALYDAEIERQTGKARLDRAAFMASLNAKAS